MRKLTLLIISLFVTLGVMAQTATLEVSTNVGYPEYQYQIKSANNIWMAASTTPTQNNKGSFAFFAADGDNAYKIYSIDQQKWVSYDKSNTSNDCRNFATLVASQDDANAWKITSATRSGSAVYQIQPFNSDGTVTARYWNWNGGVGSGGSYGYNYDDGKTIGLWRDNASQDGGSAWILVEHVEAISEITEFVNGDAYTFVSERGWMGALSSLEYVVSTARTQNNIAATDIKRTNPNFQWTVYTSQRTGSRYLYNIGKGMFMGVESRNNTKVPFVEIPAGGNLTFKKSSNATYPIMFSTDNAAVVNHTTDRDYGLISWTGGWNNLNDGGSNHKVVKVGFIDDEVLANIEKCVAEYELRESLAKLDAAILKAKTCTIGTNVGEYSAVADFSTELASIETFRADLTAETTQSDVENKAAEALALITLNLPENGKYYRLAYDFGDNGVKYVQGVASEVSGKANAMLMTEDKDAASIFYYSDNKLRSYTAGKYVKEDGGTRGLVAEGGEVTFEAGFAIGKIAVKAPSYMHAAKSGDIYFVDHCGDKGNHTAHDFIVEEVTELPITLEPGYYAIGIGGKYVSDDKKSDSETQRVLTTGEVTSKNIFYYDGEALIGYASGCGFEYACCNTGKEGPLNFFTFYRSTTSGEYLIKSSDGNSTVGWANGFWKANDGNYLERVDKENASLWTLTPVTMAAKIGEQVYYTLAEAANVATKGQTVTILRSTDETAVFAYGVVIEKAEGVVAPNATNEVAVDVPADVVGNIVNNSGVETETVNGVVGALQNNEAVISNTPTNLPVGAKLVVKLVNIIFESEAPAKVVYDVTPKKDGAEVEPTEEITFRLPVPANWKYAKVYHETALEGIYPVQEGNYVEVASQDFSEFAVEIAEPVAKIGDVDYYTFEAALAAAKADETITLVADVTCTEKPVFNNGGVVNVDINGHVFVSSEKARVRCVGNSTVASNNIKFVRGFGWEVYYKDKADEKFRVFPTLDEAVAYKSGTNAANIYPYEDVVQGKDITFRTTGEQTSTALTNDAGYKTSWDLNGFTVLQETAAGNPLESTVLGEFTLLDSSAEKTGKWIAGAYNGNTGGGPAFIVNRADAHLILQGGTISIARNGDVVNTGGLINTYYGTLTVDGATLQMDDQYGIMAWGGNVVVESGEFVLGENNSSSVFAMKYYADASVTINANLGGTLYAHKSATATVNVPGVKYVSGADYVAPDVAEGLVAQGGVVGYPVAKIGETGYLTLEAAVAAATEGATITMLSDVELTETLVIAEGKTITLNLNGKTVDVAWEDEEACKHFYALTNNGTLTVTGNGTINTRGIFNYGAMTLTSGTINAIDGNGGYGVRNYTGATFTMDGGTIATTLEDDNKVSEGGFDATPVRVDEGATFTMNGGVINNICDFTVAIDNHGTTIIEGGEATTVHTTLANRGTMTINGGEFTCNGIEGITAHALWAAAGETTINGGTFNGKDNYNGFNVDASKDAVVNITGGTFLAVHSGSLYGEGTITVSGGTFFDAVPANRCAEGFVCEANGDGTYGVKFASYIVLPDGVNSSNCAELFGDNTVTDGTNYYATLQAAVEAVAGQANAVLYCKPGADVGSLQHAPVTSTLTVYGNGADVTGDTERDFDLSNTDPSGGNDITADMTLTVKHLNGCGAWGAKATEHTVNLVFENCANMGKVFITGTTGTLNITMTDCAFEGVINEAVYSNADGAITLTNVAFSNLNKAVNLNHKAAGTQTVTIDGCTFTNCGADVAADQIPVRVLSSVEGGKSVLTVTGSTFTGTPEGGADILLDYGVGLTTASVSGTAANVVVEKENNVGTTTAVKAEETVEFTTALPVAQVGETKYMTLAEALAAAQTDATVTLVNNVALETPVVISGKALTLDLGAYTIEDKSTAVLTDEDNVWALIDLENGANLTVRGTGTIKANYANVQGGWTGMAYCINVDNTSKLTVDGGNFINGNGGVQTRGEVVVNGGTFVSHNGGTCIMAIYTDAKVTVNGGTFKDSVEESDVYTGSGAVWAGFGAKIEIKGGTFDFAADPEHGNVVWTLFPAQNAIAGTGVNAEMTVSGGTFVNFNPAKDVVVDYSPSTGFTLGSVVAEGYTVVANADGTYGVVVDPAYGKVAKVGDAYYATIADAVAAATDGATITMLSDVELTEAVKVVGKAITLDLNGKTVSGTCNAGQSSLVYIENNAALTVVDNSDAKDGKLTYAKGTSNVGWTVDVKGAFTLEAGTVELTGDNWSIGYAVDVRPNSWGTEYTNPSVFTMNGGKLVSSDGAVRVASSSAPAHKQVAASFEMNGGKIDAAWDGVFIQQSDAAYDVLNFTINDGTIESGLNPVRVYGPAPTSYVNGQECMSINFNGGTMTYTGTETLEWVIDGVLRVGGGSSIETIVENGNITAGETFAQAQALPEGYIWEQDGETYKVVEAPKAPEVVDGKIEFVDGEFDMYTNDTDIEGVEITYKRTIDSDWNALYVPFAIPASELLADFDIAYINDVRETDADDDGELDGWQMELIKIKKETAVLRANHPYFVRSKSADYTENNLSLTLTTTLYKATVAEFECSSVYSTYTIKGLNELRASTEFGDADRVLGYDNGETTWGKMADGYSLKPFRFYLTITNHDGSPVVSSSAQMSIVVRDEDGTTGIDGIYGDENGETVIFDLYGRRVLEPEKGNIYIINGKKVLVK